MKEMASHERDGQEGRKISLSIFSPGLAWEAVFPTESSGVLAAETKHPVRQELETGVQQMRQADVKLRTALSRLGSNVGSLSGQLGLRRRDCREDALHGQLTFLS